MVMAVVIARDNLLVAQPCCVFVVGYVELLYSLVVSCEWHVIVTRLGFRALQYESNVQQSWAFRVCVCCVPWLLPLCPHQEYPSAQRYMRLMVFVYRLVRQFTVSE